MAERDIQHQIREALGLEPDLCLWRNNSGVFDDGRGGKVRTGLGVGSADLVGILQIDHITTGGGTRIGLNLGRFFALEIKTARGRTTDEQDQWLELVRRRGGFAAVVRSVQEAKQALERARRGESK